MARTYSDKNPLIVCAGIAVVDHVFRIERFPEPGTKTRSREFAAVGGGCAANAAVAIARLGGRVRLGAPLGGPAGEDMIGDSILAMLNAEKIDTAGVVRLAGTTSPVSAILVDTSGERLIVNHRSAALGSVRCADPQSLIADADAVLIDNRFPEFALDVAQAARARGLVVLMDADEPTRETDALFASCTHVVFSAEGLRATAQTGDLPQALQQIAGRTKAHLAVTDGPGGLFWLAGGALRHIPAHRIEAVDTLGAGDVFHGACVLALAEGRDFEQAMHFAAAAAAIKCTRFGGIGGAPVREEVERFMASGAFRAET